MSFVKALKSLSLAVIFSLSLSVVFYAQVETPTPTPKQRERVSKNNPTENPKTEATPVVETNQTEPVPTSTPEKQEDPEDTEIKNAVVQPYVNYLTKYELGPEDVISIEVFGQCDKGLCKTITVSPTTIIYFPFIPGGVFVGGKTTEQVAKEMSKKLEEYIIEPQVTVNLEKVVSAQYAVLGRVAAPGIRTMTRKYTVYEAITEAGGLLPDADKKRITLMRRTSLGSYEPTTIKLDEMIAGKIPMEVLSPGDQIIILEKKWSLSKVLQYVNMAIGFRGIAPGIR